MRSDPSRSIHDELGPTSRAWLEGAGAPLLEERRASGASGRDAVLGALFDGSKRAEREELRLSLAGEFWGHVLRRLQHANGLTFDRDREDVLQSALASVWAESGNLEFRGESQFLSYLARRMRWKAATRRRRLSPRSWEDDDAVPDGGPGPGTRLAHESGRESLRAQIERLGARDRYLVLARIEGIPLEEQALELGITENSCQRACQRALTRLMERLCNRSLDDRSGDLQR